MRHLSSRPYLFGRSGMTPSAKSRQCQWSTGASVHIAASQACRVNLRARMGRRGAGRRAGCFQTGERKEDARVGSSSEK